MHLPTLERRAVELAIRDVGKGSPHLCSIFLDHGGDATQQHARNNIPLGACASAAEHADMLLDHIIHGEEAAATAVVANQA